MNDELEIKATNEGTRAILEDGNQQAADIEALLVALCQAKDEQGRLMDIEVSELISLVPEIAKLVSNQRMPINDIDRIARPA